jgi:hypothetical protein
LLTNAQLISSEKALVDDSKFGNLRVIQWQNLHFSGSASHSMQLILVERIESAAPGTKPKPLLDATTVFVKSV